MLPNRGEGGTKSLLVGGGHQEPFGKGALSSHREGDTESPKGGRVPRVIGIEGTESPGGGNTESP